MSNPSNQPVYTRLSSSLDAAGIVEELLAENAAAVSSSDHTNPVSMDTCFGTSSDFLSDLVTPGDQRIPQYNYNPFPIGCPTPPESERGANTPSPIGVQNPLTPSAPREGNFNCMSFVSSAGPSSVAIPAPCRYQPSSQSNGNYPISSSLPVRTGEFAGRRPARRPQVTSAQCNEASIKILNPSPEYDKVQKKHGPRGKFSEQRISRGQVEMEIETLLPLSHLEVYVMRDFEAEKKLVAKDPNSYGVGATRIPKVDVKVDGVLMGTLDLLGQNPGVTFSRGVATPSKYCQNSKYICKFDFDSVYKTDDNKEVYRLEKTRGLEFNRFLLKVYLAFVNGTSVTLYPYEFVLKSSKTVKANGPAHGAFPSSAACSSTATCASPHGVPSDGRHYSFVCQQLEAEFARITNLEVEQIKTANHDIAYYIKRKNPDESPFEEGDVVGFFESPRGDTVIDFLTSENAHEARLAGVISRSAYIKGNIGRYDKEKNDADLVCIIGEIQVKVIGRVRTGELIYTCPSNKFPGTATARQEQGNHRQTLIGYAMGEASGPGVSKVDCLVSLVLSIGAKEQLRALDQMRLSIEEMKENFITSIDTVGVRIARMQRGWRGLWKKLLAVTVFLAVAALVCGLMLAPSSPYVKAKCRANSIKDHWLTFTFYPQHSDDEIIVTGLEFTWAKLKKKLSLRINKINGTEGYRYFLNKARCETGGIRSVASWLDPSPLEPKVNVLAVDSSCHKVYYHSRKEGEWFQYYSVRDVLCHPPAGSR